MQHDTHKDHKATPSVVKGKKAQRTQKYGYKKDKRNEIRHAYKNEFIVYGN
jgi:hypothetical protein